MSDPAAWARLPVLAAVARRWWSARGKGGEFKVAFSCDWEELLTQAGLVSAELRREADRDARRMEQASLVKLRTVKYRPYEIERLAIPFAAESRLRELFAAELPSASVALPDLSGIVWQEELRFLAGIRTSVPVDDLMSLNRFFEKGGRDREPLPIKERSLEIFGDEKRLDALRVTALFRPGQLSLSLLRCFVVPLPFGWRRGPLADGPVLVIENAATWDSYCRWNEITGRYSAVVFGNGYQFSDSPASLQIIFEELGGPRPILYFGDLDPTGVWIPQQTSVWLQERNLPAVQADLEGYGWLLILGLGRECSRRDGSEDTQEVDLSWLGSHAEAVSVLFSKSQRLPQELVTWEFLRQKI